MKKLRIVALISVLLLCLTLCSCNVDIAEMRSRHGKWNADGNIVLNGTVYKPLPECNMLVTNIIGPYYYSYPLNEEEINVSSPYYITESDVPVLLSEDKGTTFFTDKEEIFLQENPYYSYYSYINTDSSAVVYCREDHYDSIVSQIENGISLPHYYYQYMVMQEGGIHSWEKYQLTDAEAAAMNTVLSSETAIISEAIDYYTFDQTVSLYVESTDGFFCTNTDLLIRQIGDTYFLHDRTNKEYDRLITVPEEYNDTFASIMAAVVAAE